MGTNYFSIDPHIGKKHIGKKSAGWTFLFHGYDEYDFKIKTSYEWKDYLLNDNVDVYDEEKQKINKEYLLKRIEDSLSERGHNVKKHENAWYDERGFLFIDNYFS